MAPVSMKRKAITKLAKSASAAVSKQPLVEEHEEDETLQEAPKKSEKEVEKETAAAREGELKSVPVADLKQLIEVKGLSTGNRADMMKAILKAEAAERAEGRQKEAQVREVVVNKKEELEAMNAADLKGLCSSVGVKVASRTERIEQALAKWLQDDGVNKELARKAYEKRESELNAMEKPALQKLCEKASVDPFVKDVLVDRIIKREVESGKFKKPALSLVEKTALVVPHHTNTDMVEALLAQKRQDEEAAERRLKEEAAVAGKIKELKSKSPEALKKLLKQRGLEVSGKKETVIEALHAAIAEEEAVTARKSELKAMDKEELVTIIKNRGLEPTGSKDKMMVAVLTHEAQIVHELKNYKLKTVEGSKIKEAALSKKTGTQLKDMCAAKKVVVGGSNEDKIKRLVEVAQVDGEIDQIIFETSRDTRTKELFCMEKPELAKLATSMAVDALVKEVMVERILSHEGESREPVTKKARK